MKKNKIDQKDEKNRKWIIKEKTVKIKIVERKRKNEKKKKRDAWVLELW